VRRGQSRQAHDEVSSVPDEAEKLYAVPPDQFVDERKELAKKLRDEGRKDEADAVAALRKPSAVVFASNRAARDRPKAAQAAAEAAVRVRDAQAAGDADAFGKALGELDQSLDLLAEVALAHVAPAGKQPTDAMRRRVRDLLRSAVADDDARDSLVRGALAEELEAPGFSPYAGMKVAAKPAGRRTKEPEPAEASRTEKAAARKRERRKELRDELAQAERTLREATTAAREAERARARAEKAVATIRKKLDEA
jgi:hypothetical protein